MSGHNKWSQIKRKKGINDSAKGKIYTKISKQIIQAVKQNGSDDPESNFALKMAISSAREADMPMDNVKSAILKASDKSQKNTLESIVYEAYSYGNSSLLIECLTDNRNRTVANIREIIEKGGGGKLVPSNSILWKFAIVGYISLLSETKEEHEQYEKKLKSMSIRNIDTSNEKRKLQSGNHEFIDSFMLELLDVEGIIDIKEENVVDEDRGEDGVFSIDIYTLDKSLASIRKLIDEKYKFEIETSKLIYLANEQIHLEQVQVEKLQNLILSLEEDDDVISCYTDVSNIW